MKTRCANDGLQRAMQYAQQINIVWNLDDEEARSFCFYPQSQIIMPLYDERMTAPTGGGAFLRKNIDEEKHRWLPSFHSQLNQGKQVLFLFVGQVTVNRFTRDTLIEDSDRVWRWHLDNLKGCEQEYRAYYRIQPPPSPWDYKRWSVDFKNAEIAYDQWNAQRRACFIKEIHPKLLGTLGVLIDAFGDCSSYTITGGRVDKENYCRRLIKVINHHNRKLDGQKRLESFIAKDWPSIVQKLMPHFRADGRELKAIQRAHSRGKISTAAARAWFAKQNLLSRFIGWAKSEQTTKQHA